MRHFSLDDYLDFCFDNAFNDSTFSGVLGFGIGSFSDKFKFLDKSNMTGDAMKIDEYVPMKIPTINANANPLMLEPPKINKIKTTNNTLKDVIMVRLKVLLIALLIISRIGKLL